MTIIGRVLLTLVTLALIAETVVAWNVFEQAETTPREPITVGARVENSLRERSELSRKIDVVLATPIEAPVPADRIPPPLHSSSRKAAQVAKNTGDSPNAPAAAATTPMPAAPEPGATTEVAAAGSVEPVPVTPAAPERPIPPPAPEPRLEPIAPEPVAAKSASTGSGMTSRAPDPKAPAAKEPLTVAANVPPPELTSPFAEPMPPRPNLEDEPAKKAEPDPPAKKADEPAAIPPFERPALGPVTVDADRAADAVRRLEALGAQVSDAIDREGVVLPGRFSVRIDPNPNGDAMTRLGLSVQSQLGRALGDLGDSLHTLTLRNVGLGNLGWVTSNVGLVTLDLTGSKFLNIEPLTRLPRLESLNVSRTHVDNMVLASMIRNLRVLNLGSAGVIDIGPLGAHQGLEELYLNETRVGSVEAVARMTRLKVLDISGTRVTDLRPLARCPSLRRLGMARTGANDLTTLAECTGLIGLDLSGCTDIREIAPLGNLTRLEMLSLFGVPVERIDALAGCVSLHTLELSRTGVRDLTPLGKLSELRELYLRGLVLDRAEPLATLPALKTLDLTGTTFADAQAFAELRNALTDKGVEIRQPAASP